MLQKVSCKKYFQHKFEVVVDTIAIEREIEICFQDVVYKLYSSPYELEALVLGYAKLELLQAGCVPVIYKQKGYKFWVGQEKKFKLQDCQQEPSIDIKGQDILWLEEKFMAKKGLWDSTGCFHRAAVWMEEQRQFVFEVEDIARHNCIDRIMGLSLLQSKELSGGMLFVSARITSSLLKKIIKTGLKVVISRSAVTSGALDLAIKNQITLIGFARGGRFSVFNLSKGAGEFG
ncbi:MAG: formate dehydrogenase accessory sulfurtransferase FdhD [Desulfonauticus sp.]|nr:formate dehydrogenase accessory sulfurtransferase FdhD [Desulfonauticus sp.]